MSDAIVVSGMGCISAAGKNVAEFSSSIFQPSLSSCISTTNILKLDEKMLI